MSFVLAHGVHRSLIRFLTVSFVIGAASGAAIMWAPGGLGACFGALGLLVLGPLAWVATVRIAWPMRELADVAEGLRRGELLRREDLPSGAANEVGEVATALRGLSDRMADQLRAQRDLMAAVSHELRSPLGRVRVLAELARDGGAPDSVVDELDREVAAMDTLVGDLLAAARIDFEAVHPVVIPVDDLVARVVEGRPEVAVVVSDGSSAVRVDATLVSRALSAMLDNARRYGGEHVALTVEARGDRVVFHVDDDGRGFLDADPEVAFEPFHRGPPLPDGTRPEGVGLGLALVRRIAEQHGGTAVAGNRRPGGARVTLELPRA